jgi:hypothetical protein
LGAEASTPAAGPAPAVSAPAAPSPPPATAEAAKPLTAEAAAAGRSLRKVYKAIAASVGVISSITGLIFVFAPDLKPSPAAPIQSAKLSDLRVDADATFRQYLARIDQSPAGYSAQQLQRRGALLDFRVRIEGFKGRTLLLKWELFDDKTGIERRESKAIQITPTNATNEATWQFWVPLPNDRGRYVAIVELIEQKKSHLLKLASLETDMLSGLAG